MRPTVLFFALAVLGGSSLRAQAPAPDTAGVRRAALDYLEGFCEGDTAKIVRSVRPELSKCRYWLPRDSWMITHVLWQSPPAQPKRPS